MAQIIRKIEKKLGLTGLVDQIDAELSGTELNSLLLSLFRKRAAKSTPPEVLRQYRENRFTIPSAVDPLAYREAEIEWLKSGREKGYEPVELSPLAPLGSSAVFGFVDQNNVVSALRGTEIVSDATNMLAIQIAHESKNQLDKPRKKFCTTHRHVRSQYFKNPSFTAHFGVYCMVSGGYVEHLSYLEPELAEEHVLFYVKMLSGIFDQSQLTIDLEVTGSSTHVSDELVGVIEREHPAIRLHLEIKTAMEAYYRKLRFRVNLEHKGHLINLVDGGFVDWTQKMLQNKKHRLFISGIGLELVYKIRQGMI